MNRGTKFEDRASGSQGKHEGESSAHLCDRLCRTRDTSQRQLPTDQDYAVSTREYQTDQSSLKTAPTAARSVLELRRKQRQQQTQRLQRLTRSLHIRPTRSLTYSDRSVSSASCRITGFSDRWRRLPVKCIKSRISASSMVQAFTGPQDVVGVRRWRVRCGFLFAAGHITRHKSYESAQIA
jgi:hypothetical protein